MNKIVGLLVIPLVVFLVLMFSRTPESPQVNATQTTTTLTPTTARGWSGYLLLFAGLLVGAVGIYIANKRQWISLGRSEEEIKEMLRDYLRTSRESMILNEILWTDYEPLDKHKIVRLIFTVRSPESLIGTFNYIEFYSGRFRGLKKYLSWADVQDLLKIRLVKPLHYREIKPKHRVKRHKPRKTTVVEEEERE